MNAESKGLRLLSMAMACVALLILHGDALAAAPLGHYTVGDGPLAGTVLDNETGLRWQQAVDAMTRTQAASVLYCDGLVLAGFSDWRLPSVLELASIVDENVASPAPTIDSSAFPSTPAERFWSSSPSASSPSNGWYVYFNAGNAANDVATDNNRARCVR